jgi:hypothetical protein
MNQHPSYATDQSPANHNWNNYNASGFAYAVNQQQQHQQQFTLPWMQQQQQQQAAQPQVQLHDLHQQHLNLQQQIQQQYQDLQQQQVRLVQQMEHAAPDQQSQLQLKHLQLQFQEQTLQQQLLEQQQLLLQLPPANFQYSLTYDHQKQSTQATFQSTAVPANASAPYSNYTNAKPQQQLNAKTTIPDVHAKPATPSFTSFAITTPANSQSTAMLNSSLFNASKKKKTSNVIASAPTTVDHSTTSSLNTNANMTPPQLKARKRVMSATPPVFEGMLDDDTILPPHLSHSSAQHLDTFAGGGSVGKKSKFSAAGPIVKPPPPKTTPPAPCMPLGSF